jgi:hypothetical protein
MPLMAVSGNSRFLRTGFRTRACCSHRVAEGGLHLKGKVNALDRRVKHFRKNILSFEASFASHPCNLFLLN